MHGSCVKLRAERVSEMLLRKRVGDEERPFSFACQLDSREARRPHKKRKREGKPAPKKQDGVARANPHSSCRMGARRDDGEARYNPLCRDHDRGVSGMGKVLSPGVDEGIAAADDDDDGSDSDSSGGAVRVDPAFSLLTQHLLSALEAKIWESAFKVIAFNCNLRHYTAGATATSRRRRSARASRVCGTSARSAAKSRASCTRSMRSNPGERPSAGWTRSWNLYEGRWGRSTRWNGRPRLSRSTQRGRRRERLRR